MKRLILLLTVAFLISSCNNPLDVSVTSELPKELVASRSDKDSTFLDFYKEVRFLVDSVYSKGGYDSYKNLKYSDLFKYVEYHMSQKKHLIDKGIYKEWSAIYENDFKKFAKDSIKYKKYMDENDYSNFMSLSLDTVYKKKNWISSDNVADIIVEPLNGNIIRKIVGFIVITDKGEERSMSALLEESGFFSHNGVMRNKQKITTYPTTSSYSRGLSSFLDIPVDIIKQKHDIYFDIDDLIIGDRYVDVKLDSIPYEMKRYLEKGYDFSKDYYIEKYINKDYVYFSGYLVNKIRSDMPSKFKKVTDFYDIGYRQYHSRESNALDQ